MAGRIEWRGEAGEEDGVDRATRLKLSAEAECDVRTVVALEEGRSVRPLLRDRIERAAKKLKIKLPKPRVERP